jgi:prevent-host-death family protein
VQYRTVRSIGRIPSKGAEEARNQLPSLLDSAERGRATVITKHGRAVAALVPIADFHPERGQSSLAELKGSGRGLWGKVLTGPLQAGDNALAQRYRAVLDSWRVVDLNAGLAEDAARLRVTLRLNLPEAIQAASALAINADALVTSDRDFSRLSALRVLR